MMKFQWLFWFKLHDASSQELYKFSSATSFVLFSCGTFRIRSLHLIAAAVQQCSKVSEQGKTTNTLDELGTSKHEIFHIQIEFM